VTLPALPKQSQPIAGTGGVVTTPWYDFLARRDAALSGDTAELSAQVAALSEQVANLAVGEVIGLFSVSVSGSLSEGQAFVQLAGDSANPGSSYYYGTDSSAAKGWYPLPDSAVPFFIPDGDTYTVAENKQALFALPIELDGTASLVVDGALVEVG
jgi:hypothetical protein